MIPQKVLYVDITTGKFNVENISDPDIIGPVDFGFKEMVKDKSALTFGMGILAATEIPGTRRMIFSGYSPLWQNFYISTLGGGSYVFRRLGVNYVSLKGKRDGFNVMIINRKEGKMVVSFEKVDVEDIWKGYDSLKGFYALQKYVFDKYSKQFDMFRILATGPSSLKGLSGAIGSAPVENGKLTNVDCWAGRGGMGSKLIQEHGIVAIIYGGDHFTPLPVDKDKLDEVFKTVEGKNMILTDMSATTKYRYDDKVGSGGTFGVNYSKLKGLMFSFNYSSIYKSERERVDLHKAFVLDHYLKQFNEETIGPKNFKHCGEPCPAVCKKMHKTYKKDYEPYQVLGPNSGIFDQRAAEKINHHVDAMGFDAIQIGGMVAWIMELLDKKLISPKDLGLDAVPHWNIENFDLVKDSMHNANLAVDIVNMILFSEHNKIFCKGIRNAAKELDNRFGIDSINLAVFLSYGKSGCMIPNQYWTPGMFSPMPIMGKYFEYYGNEILMPKNLGKKNSERMIYELFNDNIGTCRFHRKWVEKIMPDLIKLVYDTDIDLFEHNKKIAAQINEHNNSVFWESERVIDIVYRYLVRRKETEPEHAGINEWIAKFSTDKIAAAKEFWELTLEGINESLK